MHQDIGPEPVGLEPDAPECPWCFRATQRVQVGMVTWRHCPVCKLYWIGPRPKRRLSPEQDAANAKLLAGSEYVSRPWQGDT